MAGFSIELVGLSEVIGELKGLGLKTEAQVIDAVKGATNDARDASLPLIPVSQHGSGGHEPGFLKGSQEVWFVGAIGAQLIWGELRNNAPYSRWVCFGHHTRSGSWVAPQDFMTGPILVGEHSLMERLAAIYG